MNILMMGPQGSGKGSQGARLSKDLHIPVLSMGDVLRSCTADGVQECRAAKRYMDAGELVPDDLTVSLLKRELKKEKYTNGLILDGFPRTRAQAEALESIIAPDAVIVLDVTLDLIMRRLTTRRVCKNGHIYNTITNPPRNAGECDIDGLPVYQREDDTERVIAERLLAYQQQTAPVIDYYEAKGITHHIDADGTVEEVNERIISTLEK